MDLKKILTNKKDKINKNSLDSSQNINNDLKDKINNNELKSEKKKIFFGLKTLEKKDDILSEEEESSQIFNTILIWAAGASIITGGITLYSSIKYNPMENISVDTSSVSQAQSFLSSIDLTKYTDMIAKHNNETQNNELDIKKVNSNIGREFPFTTILNRYNENVTTKLTKFIYTELKPAIISYKISNGGAIPKTEDIPTEDMYYTVSLSDLDTLLNIRDASLSGYTYKMRDSSINSNIKIKVYDGENEIPVIMFDIAEFKIKNLSENQVSLDYGNYNLVLGIKEEFNNVRLEKIVYNQDEKYILLVDTLTNKQVKIIKK